MKNILLVCNAGMSTSMLVKKMQDAAKASNLDVNIEAKSLTEAKKSFENVDIILLGPQVRYELENLKKAVPESIKVEAIDMRDYGMMNGQKVLEKAIKSIGE